MTLKVPRTQRSVSSTVRGRAGAMQPSATLCLGPGSAAAALHAAARPGHETALPRLVSHHPRHDAVAADEVVPERGDDVNRDQGEQHIGKQDVAVLIGVRRRLVR